MFHVAGEKWLQMCSLIELQLCLSELRFVTGQTPNINSLLTITQSELDVRAQKG